MKVWAMLVDGYEDVGLFRLYQSRESAEAFADAYASEQNKSNDDWPKDMDMLYSRTEGGNRRWVRSEGHEAISVEQIEVEP